MNDVILKLDNNDNKWQMILIKENNSILIQEFENKPNEEETRLIVSIVSNILNSVPNYEENQLIFSV